jgi:hypothetical protein
VPAGVPKVMNARASWLPAVGIICYYSYICSRSNNNKRYYFRQWPPFADIPSGDRHVDEKGGRASQGIKPFFTLFYFIYFLNGSTGSTNVRVRTYSLNSTYLGTPARYTKHGPKLTTCSLPQPAMHTPPRPNRQTNTRSQAGF